jgi:hypothetical protein
MPKVNKKQNKISSPKEKKSISKIRVSKIPSLPAGGCPKETELSSLSDLANHKDKENISTFGVSQAVDLYDNQSRREKLPHSSKDECEKRTRKVIFRVPVVLSDGRAIMPCHPARARELIRKGKAKKQFKNGIFYIKLLERKDGEIQEISCGVDPGSKREGFTVKSENKTFINILLNAENHVKERIKSKRELRRNRRYRKTPCRRNNLNRACLRKEGRIPPSTKSRWLKKLNILKFLRKLYPISIYIVEDIAAVNKEGKRKWNISFSTLEVGKNWFYTKINKLGKLILKQGYETAEMRNKLGLIKTKEQIRKYFLCS